MLDPTRLGTFPRRRQEEKQERGWVKEDASYWKIFFLVATMSFGGYFRNLSVFRFHTSNYNHHWMVFFEASRRIKEDDLTTGSLSSLSSSRRSRWTGSAVGGTGSFVCINCACFALVSVQHRPSLTNYLECANFNSRKQVLAMNKPTQGHNGTAKRTINNNKIS